MAECIGCEHCCRFRGGGRDDPVGPHQNGPPNAATGPRLCRERDAVHGWQDIFFRMTRKRRHRGCGQQKNSVLEPRFWVPREMVVVVLPSALLIDVWQTWFHKCYPGGKHDPISLPLQQYFPGARVFYVCACVCVCLNRPRSNDATATTTTAATGRATATSRAGCGGSGPRTLAGGNGAGGGRRPAERSRTPARTLPPRRR
jgi:hypothetical protein